MIDKKIIDSVVDSVFNRAKKEFKSNKDDKRRLQKLHEDNHAILHVIQLLGTSNEDLVVTTRLMDMAKNNMKEITEIYNK